MIFKFFNKGANCVSPVAYLIFNFRVKFRCGAAIFRKIKIGVIAESVCSGAVFGYFAVEITFGGKGFSVRINKNDRAGVMGFFVFFAAEFFKKKLVVGFVVAVMSAKSCGINSRKEGSSEKIQGTVLPKYAENCLKYLSWVQRMNCRTASGLSVSTYA